MPFLISLHWCCSNCEGLECNIKDTEQQRRAWDTLHACLCCESRHAFAVKLVMWIIKPDHSHGLIKTRNWKQYYFLFALGHQNWTFNTKTLKSYLVLDWNQISLLHPLVFPICLLHDLFLQNFLSFHFGLGKRNKVYQRQNNRNIANPSNYEHQQTIV